MSHNAKKVGADERPSSEPGREPLRESEELFRAMFDLHHTVKMIIDPDSGAIIDANAAATRFYGYSREELLSMTIQEINTLPPEEVEAECCRAVAEKRNYFIFPHRLASGETRWVEVYSSPIPYHGRTLLHSTIHDITARKKAEQDLAESEVRLGTFIEHAPAAMAMFDRNMVYLSVSRRWRENFQQREDELIGRCHYDLHPELPEYLREAHATGMAGHVVSADEDKYPHPDGREQWSRWAVHPWRDASGEVGGIIIFFEDITERKKNQQKMQQQKELLEGIFESAPVMFMLWDAHLQHFTLNRKVEELLGWTTADANDGDFMAKVYPDPDYRAEVSAYMQSLETGWREFSITCKDGRAIPAEWANVRLTDETMVGIGVDLRERKQAEKAQRRLAQFPLENPNPVMRLDVQGKLLFANRNAWQWLETLGWAGEGALPEGILDTVRRAREKKGVVEAEIEDVSGRTLWVSAVCLQSEGYVNLYGRDVTERKNAESELLKLNQLLEQRVTERTDELAKAESKFRGLVENSSDILCRIDVTGQLSYLAPQAREYGFDPSDWEGRPFFDAVHPEDRVWMAEDFQQMLETNESIPSQFRIIAPDGCLYWFEERSTIEYGSRGEIVGLVIVLRDISEKQKLDTERELQNRKLQLALDASRMGWWRLDPVTREGSYDARLQEIFGFTEEHRSVDEIYELVHPDDIERLHASAGAALNPDASDHSYIEYRIFRPDGEMRWVEAHGLAIFEGEGENRHAIDFVGTVEDVTERKNYDQLLHDKEERYRVLFESESDAILVFDGETRRFIDVNTASLSMYGYTHAEFLRMTQGEISADPVQAQEKIPAVLSGKRFPAFRSRHRKKDGTEFPVEISAACLEIRGRKVISAVVRDISRRLEQEQELDRNREELRRLASELSLANQRERQRIAGELHDGLSQLLSSASLWLDTVAGIDVPEQPRRALDKVREIIEQALGQTRSLTFDLSCPLLYELGLAAALEDLCANLSQEYGIQLRFKGVLKADALPLEQQLLLYRAVRELLINVIKHSEAQSAEVILSHKDGILTLRVSDDGNGFDPTMAGRGFSPTGGFGLFNIGEYIRHEGGELAVDSSPNEGTQVTLSVSMKED